MNSNGYHESGDHFQTERYKFTISAACASGSHAIGLGYHFIKTGLQESVITGGAQEINPLSMGNFDALSAFSSHENEPGKASRPFDKDRDGFPVAERQRLFWKP
ncbi:MAG: beta-ketoacyl synthase N-terminal-like domain-containing protein [Puia sp.]